MKAKSRSESASLLLVSDSTVPKRVSSLLVNSGIHTYGVKANSHVSCAAAGAATRSSAPAQNFFMPFLKPKTLVICGRAAGQPRSRISRAFCRCQSRLASVARLSASFLPLAIPSWSLALPRSLK